MHRSIAAAVLILASAPASAQTWTILEEESVTLDYRDTKKEESLFSIACHRQSSEIVVPIQPGVKKGAAPVVVVMHLPKGPERLTLKVEVCGGEMQCSDRADGNVSSYRIQEKGKRLPLRAATATRFEIDAPGAKLSITADRDTFRKFERLCRGWK